MVHLGLTAALLVAGGCSLKPAQPGSTRVRIPLDALRRGTTRTPSTIGGFTCVGLNITGDQIPTTTALQGCVSAGMPAIGIRTGLVPITADSIEVSVPSGPKRVIQVFGVVSSIGCPPVSDFFSGAADISQAESPVELGRTTIDLASDTSVTINLVLDASSAQKKVFCLNDTPTGTWDDANAKWDQVYWGN
jgi:hypothetical protein